MKTLLNEHNETGNFIDSPNTMSYKEYLEIRDKNFDYIQFIKLHPRNKYIKPYSNFHKSYELSYLGINENQIKLFTYIGYFNAIAKALKNIIWFYEWWNESGDPEVEIEAVCPREYGHRCLDDIYQTKISVGGNGYTIAFENQTNNDLELQDFNYYYGQVKYCQLPGKIEANSIGYFELSFASFYNRAVGAYKYYIKKLNLYVYVCYKATFYFDASTYVCFSADNISWATLYERLSDSESSDVSPLGLTIKSTIDANGFNVNRKAVTVLHETEYDSYTSFPYNYFDIFSIWNYRTKSKRISISS